MGRYITALGLTCALAGAAAAQAMPGQVVSNGVSLSPAAPRVPAAAPQAGKNIGNPLLRPYDPNRPLDALKGTNLNPSQVVAPVQGLGGTQQPDLLDRVYDKLSSVTKFLRPSSPAPQTQGVTPGIFRRNRERNQMNWRRD
jgi:hypothetical protein